VASFALLSKRDSELGTHTRVTPRFWPWLSGEVPQNLLSYSLFARKRHLSVLQAECINEDGGWGASFALLTTRLLPE